MRYARFLLIPTKKLLLCFILLAFVACKDKTKNKENTYSTPLSSEKSAPLQKSITRGKGLYSTYCLQCHMPKGQGIPEIYPPLANSDWLSTKRAATLHAVKYGLNGEIKVNGKTYNNSMFDLGLSNQQIADVLNYVMNSWGNTQSKIVTPEEVAQIEK